MADKLTTADRRFSVLALANLLLQKYHIKIYEDETTLF
jgi:hypothetical protein